MFPFRKLTVDIYGASHASEIGVRLGGLPAGLAVDVNAVQAFLNTRKAGQNPWSTPRKEPDEAVFISGIQNGATDGTTIEATIKNTSQRSSDYDAYKNTPRPSHADYVAIVKDGANVDLAGGGRFSGRMTAPLCIAGGIALQILETRGVKLCAYVSSIGGVRGKSYDDGVTPDEVEEMRKKGDFALTKAAEMTKAVLEAREKGDSVGGTAECVAFGLPVGLGDALFGGLESRIAAAAYAVPAVKCVEFGLGKGFAEKKGSEANDPFAFENGKVVTLTNNCGGINGGISNGMPLTVRVALKPTPSISLPQRTVDLATGKETTIGIKGRHDACIVPRAVPAIKAAVALALLDAMLEDNKL